MNSNDLPSSADLYSSEGKLNFLCSLDLFPTPLIKNCPNATKKWLRAVPNVVAIQDIGINAEYDEIDNSPTRMNFIAVNMVDATESREHNLIFPTHSTNDSIDHSEDTAITTEAAAVASLINKNEHCEIDFDKDKCIYTFSDQISMETITTYISNGGTIAQNRSDVVCCGSSLVEKQTLPDGKVGMLNIDTIANHQCIDSQRGPLEELPKKTKVNKDLQDTVLNEIITQEINQTVFAKATIGKTQGYLSELLRTSKLLEDRSDHEYRRTRHNLEKIKQFLKKPRYERKRIYEEHANKKNTVVCEKQQEKQKRTILSADAKKYLCDYFHCHEGIVHKEEFQFLSSHLELDFQNVKIFYKNWKQRSKIRAR